MIGKGYETLCQPSPNLRTKTGSGMIIEIKGFLEVSFLDWPGKLCSVVFLPHCNFRCPYCHNHALVLHPDRHGSIDLGDILRRLRSFRGWIDGVCITGGEPTLHPALPELARRIKRQGFLVKLDTNGTNPEMLDRLIKENLVDAVSMDVKAPLDGFHYRRVAGVRVDLDQILRSIEILKRGDVEYQFRVTVVPGYHGEEEIRAIGRVLKAGPHVVLQNFNPENPMDETLKAVAPFDIPLLRRMEREVQAMG